MSLGSTSQKASQLSPCPEQQVRDHFHPCIPLHVSHLMPSSARSQSEPPLFHVPITEVSWPRSFRLWITTNGKGRDTLFRSQCWMWIQGWILTTLRSLRPLRMIDRKRLYEMPASSWCHMWMSQGCPAHSRGELHLVPWSLRSWAFCTKASKLGSEDSCRASTWPMHTRLPPAYGKGPTDVEQFSSRPMSWPWSAFSTYPARVSMPHAWNW
mmetsp:Transcript_6933/g.23678  ORF Transcript_6933/g.23678 Transcript_6933/m.23678 type:complete len:211 (-) Transcript_6933:466-1098(-)